MNEKPAIVMTEREHLVRAIKDGLRKIEEHDRQIEAHHEKITQQATKRAEREIEVGKALAELKAQMPNFIKWEQYLADCGIEIKRSRADQLIRIAVGRTTVEQERADTAERVAKSRAGLPIHGAGIGGNAADPESSAEARKAVFAEADQPKVLRVLASAIPEDSTVRLQVVASAIPEDSPQPIGAELRRAEVAKLVRAWVAAAPEAKREFVRERWDEIAAARQQLDANGAAHEDRWVEGDAL